MTLFVTCSAKGSPGTSVTALAFTLSWRTRMMLAECDPAGGDIAAGYLRETSLGERGLAQLSASLHRRSLAEDLWNQLIDLAPSRATAMSRLVLPGLADPAQAAGLAAGWDQLADLFASLENLSPGFDVIADCGRLNTMYRPTPLLGAANLVLLVLRPTLASIRSSATALASLRRDGIDSIGLVIVGDGAYRPKEIAIEMRAPLAAVLPHDPGVARVLSNGGELHRGRLLATAARSETAVRQLVAGRAMRVSDTGGVGVVR